MEPQETTLIYSARSNKNQKFDKRLITHIVGLAEQGVPSRDLIQAYGMARCTLQDWKRRYSICPSVRKVYCAAEKRSVVRAVETG